MGRKIHERCSLAFYGSIVRFGRCFTPNLGRPSLEEVRLRGGPGAPFDDFESTMLTCARLAWCRLKWAIQMLIIYIDLNSSTF